MGERPAISVVVPAHNEEPNLLPLCDRLVVVLENIGRPFEIVLVDDASTDGSVPLLRNFAASEPRLKVVCLRRNSGQTAALAAGFEVASGAVVVAMDGDLQHAPEDIPALLVKIDEGYDLANGWRGGRGAGGERAARSEGEAPPRLCVKRGGGATISRTAGGRTGSTGY